MIIELPYCTHCLYFYGFSAYKQEEIMNPISFLIFTDHPDGNNSTELPIR